MKRFLVFALLIQALFGTKTAPAAGADHQNALARTAGIMSNDVYRPFVINNVFNYYSNNGDGSYNKYGSNNEGFEFYKGSGKTIIFEDGVVWGGYHKGAPTPQVGGSTYRHGLQAGPILAPGTLTTDPIAADPGSPQYRIFRVRPDIGPKDDFSTVQSKVDAEELPFIGRYQDYTDQDIYTQYVKDWNDWPGNEGAPYSDVDGNGRYDPDVDIPGVPGADQTLWYVANDMDSARTALFAGSLPMGLEMQKTVWGFRRAGSLGNTIFTSTILINKSGAPIDSMFVVQWADPDLGDPTDDFVGCDTLRNLGYVYNGRPTDGIYGTTIPAGGFRLLQGPMVPSSGSIATFRNMPRPGFRNLLMTAFPLIFKGGGNYVETDFGSGANVQWYRVMNALSARTGEPIYDPARAMQTTKFALYGDPVRATDGSAGWVDGMPNGGLYPTNYADRRLCLVSGPFTMAVGDTQELVVATLAGLGADRLSSITVLRQVSDIAQLTYDSRFHTLSAPPAPMVQASPLDHAVILSWGDPSSIARTEGTVDRGYRFEGYNLYELPGPAFADSVKIGTWDLIDSVRTIVDTVEDLQFGFSVPVALQQGSDNGIVHSFLISGSHITQQPLVNGTHYYFALTAYNYNPNPIPAGIPRSFESKPLIIDVVPQSPNPGTRYASRPGDTVHATRLGEPLDARVAVQVVDPTRTTGHQYKVSFLTDSAGVATWYLVDVTANRTVAANQQVWLAPRSFFYYNYFGGDQHFPIIDGLQVSVFAPPVSINNWSSEGTPQVWSYLDGAGLGLEAYGGSTDTAAPFQTSGTIGNANEHWYSGGVGLDRLRRVEIRFAAVGTDSTWSLISPTDPNISRGYRYLRNAAVPPARPEFAPWIINKTSGFAYQDYNYSIPWSAWNMDATPPQRLAIGHLENNVAAGRVDGRWWPALGTSNYGRANVDSTGPREWWFVFDVPYGETPDPQLTTDIFNKNTPMMYLGTVTRRASFTGAEPFTGTEKFLIVPKRPITSATSYTFTSPKNTIEDPALAKGDVQAINVYPNPCVVANPYSRTPAERLVTFTHLPRKAIIRIFTLAGVLVRTLVKDDSGQFLTWDLTNEHGYDLASAMYVCHITLPDLGTSKVLKLGLILDAPIPLHW